MAFRPTAVYPKDMQTGHYKYFCVTLIYQSFVMLSCTPTKTATTETSRMETIDDSGTAEAGIEELVAFDQWEILSEADDPFPEHRTLEYQCDPSGILAEEDVLEINTNDCGYAVVGQTLRADVQAGDRVELLMYHSALSTNDEPAAAHFAITVGPHVFWEIDLDIPWQSDVYVVPKTIDWSENQGAMVRIHLHNHGGNSWRVGYLRRSR